MDWCRIVEVNFRKVFFDSISGSLCLVVWDSGIEVMSHVGTSNFVVKEVNESPWIHFVVWTVNCVESTLHEVMIVIGKVWDINISMLEPILCR